MKRFVWIGLVILALGLAISACAGVTPAAPAPEPVPAPAPGAAKETHFKNPMLWVVGVVIVAAIIYLIAAN